MKAKDIFLKSSAISGISLPILFIGLLIYSIQLAPWFDWTVHAISDLGNPIFEIFCFNCGLIIIGILMLIFSIGLYFYLGGERMGPTILAMSSIYFMGIGVFPITHPNHIHISGLFFISFPLGFFVLGLQIFRKKCDFICKMGYLAIIIGVVSLASTSILLFFSGIAIPEVIILVSGFTWCLVFGIYMLFF